jgi:phosphohistidine phosphatase
MELILWRHADAEEGEPDQDRVLTSKGRKQAARMAEWLHRRLPSRYALMSSPARRAHETALALCDSPRIVRGLAPGAGPAAYLAACGWPGRRGVAVLVGHQPDLGTALCSLLGGKAAADWSVRKGALWWLHHRVREGRGQVVVRAVVGPDLV